MAKFIAVESLGEVSKSDYGNTIRQHLLQKSGCDTFLVPTIVVRVRAGQPLPQLRREWDDALLADDTILFIPELQGGGGGGGKNPLSALLTIG